ncbi:disulfide bond formation protein B [Paracoccus sp. (in: a-proteobacteria)]|uniref:disulfide bond formation protein B n=1 Tax=Paracoccus sp. TaxID=267 RepID=UPI00396C89AC
MTGRTLSLAAGIGSALLLAAALGFQAVGYAPCELCILQRWPHVAAMAVAALILVTGHVRALALLGMLAALTAAGLALYHVGVEMTWWQGPTHCSGGVGDLTRLSAQDLMTRLQAAPVVRCDEVAWRFLGVSMAGWNAILSAGLAGLWAIAARKRG